jgi:hypothetical protein
MKNIITILFFVCLFVIGYVRESIFLVLNSVLYDIPFPYNRAYIAPPQFLYNFSANELIMAKWILTFIFSVFNLIATTFLIKYYFKNKKLTIITFYIYTIIIVLSLLVYIFGYSFTNQAFWYKISRFLIGMVQYPLLTLILFTLYYFTYKYYIIDDSDN